MINYIEEIAVVGTANRKKTIINILDHIGVTYKILGNTAENIVVSVNPSSKRMVIGAHYDAFYAGANDNAAACVILLNLISKLKDSKSSIDFVFFDKEEKGGVGSREYIKIVGKENIDSMINLDMCGMGSNIVMSYNFINTDFAYKDVFRTIVSNCENLLKELPFGDYNSFVSNGIPAIFIINSTNHDLEWYKNYSNRIVRDLNTDFMKTMHRQNDTIDTFSDYGMNMIYEYLIKYLK